MLDAVQHMIKPSSEGACDVVLPPSISAVKPAVSTSPARFVKGLALAVAMIAGVSAAPGPVVAAETPAEFIAILGTDVLAEMRSYTSLDQKEAYFRQMLNQDADLGGISRFILGPIGGTRARSSGRSSKNFLKTT